MSNVGELQMLRATKQGRAKKLERRADRRVTADATTPIEGRCDACTSTERNRSRATFRAPPRLVKISRNTVQVVGCDNCGPIYPCATPLSAARRHSTS